jgi:hypothetical protein
MITFMAATAKKPTTKKPVAKKAPAKKPAVKSTAKTAAKPATKKATSKTVAAQSAQSAQSFRLAPNTANFFSFRPSIQTVYWLVLSGVVLALGVWVILLSARVQSIYDQIDANLSADDALVAPHKTVKQ